jgi:phosphate transport system permease protein
MSSEPTPEAAVPERFRVSKGTLVLDRFMNHFIKVGGIFVIAAVFAIFIFILLQVFPLFRGASAAPEAEYAVDLENVLFWGSDDWQELPFFLQSDGQLIFRDLRPERVPGHRGQFSLDLGFPEGFQARSFSFNPVQRELVFGGEDGRLILRRIQYRPVFPAEADRIIEVDLDRPDPVDLAPGGEALDLIAYADSGNRRLVAALINDGEDLRLQAIILRRTRSLMGGETVRVGQRFDLGSDLAGTPVQLLVPRSADGIYVRTAEGEVFYFSLDGGQLTLAQRVTPFADLADTRISLMEFVLGDVSVVFGHPSGELRTFSLFRDPELDRRILGPTKSFAPLPGEPQLFSSTHRYKAFLVGAGSSVRLIFNTTETTRWSADLPFTPLSGVIAPRYDGLLFLTPGSLVRYSLDDPHPQAGWRTFFGRIHYEGQSKPTFTWQSTGGTDEFERKLSMIPLINGTLKGTVYAMLFALPIGLMAAIYTSQFLSPQLKRIIKPIMEIMASLPSVVLGFIAALWLAPIVSNQIPSVLTAITFMLLAALLLGTFHQYLPSRFRSRVPDGWEFLPLVPLIFLGGWLGWQAGAWLESIFFIVEQTAPDGSVLAVADFRLWWTNTREWSFETSNAFVVGFVMGFAVIPIIFTISEDAMSNVPEAFRSGSLALGASRWQTALSVIIPTASPGIFSAFMIGLGRAIGETMIVVMATGNTPVTDFNIFTGMRTLSANIAVELPEAPSGGTLYRTLFLGALLLFSFTFLVNTVAEIMRQYLREKYRAVE